MILSFFTWRLMPMLDVIQDSLMSSANSRWTACGVVQAATRSADESMRCLSEISDKRQNVRIAARHSVVGSNSLSSCSRCKRSDKSAHSNRNFSRRCSASVDAATACGFSRDRCSIHERAACSESVGIPKDAMRWMFDLLVFNFLPSSF